MISRRQIIRHQLEEDEHRQLRTVSSLGANNHHNNHHQNGNHNRLDQFDPYSIYGEEDDEEDVWYSEDRLFEDHIQEVIDKWHSIDDEIWAKIICMERNRRIAKAYGRKHVLTINGSHDDYIDGTILGLNSFDNPDRDVKTKHIKQYIGHGVRIKIDDSGDIWVKRLSKCSVYLRKVGASNANANANSSNNNNNSAGNSSSSSDSYMANSSNNSDLNDFYGIVGYPPHNASSHNINQRHSHKLAPADPSAIGISGSKGQHRQQQQQQQSAGGAGKQHGNGKVSSNNQFIMLNSSSSAGSSASSGAGSTSINQQHSSGSKQHSNAGKKSLMSSSSDMGQQQDKKGSASKLLSGEINSYGSVSLDTDVAHKIFDMDAFKQALAHELRQSCPNRCKLLNCCISIISFVVDDKKLLNLPSWVMIINIVAIDLLKTELGLTDQDLLNPMSPGALLGQPYSPSQLHRQQQQQHHTNNLFAYRASSHAGKSRLMNGSSQDDVMCASEAANNDGPTGKPFQHLRTRITNNHKRNLFNNMDDTCLFSNSHNSHHKQHNFANGASHLLRSSLSQENLLLGSEQHHTQQGGYNGSHVNIGKNGLAAARKAFADAAAAGIYNQVKLTSNGPDLAMMNANGNGKNGLARYRNIQIMKGGAGGGHHQCDENCPIACSQQQQSKALFSHPHRLSQSKHDMTNVDESSEGSCCLEEPCCCHGHTGEMAPTNGMAGNGDTAKHHSCASKNQNGSTSSQNLSSSSGFDSHSSSTFTTTEQQLLPAGQAKTSGAKAPDNNRAGQMVMSQQASLSGADTTSASIYGPIKMSATNDDIDIICGGKCCDCQQCTTAATSNCCNEHDRCCPQTASQPAQQRYLSHDDCAGPAGELPVAKQHHSKYLHSAYHNHHHHYHGRTVEQGANLLLVAPTGLSPQLPTKLAHTPHFSTIQYIDGNGQCNVLHNDIAELNKGKSAPEKTGAAASSTSTNINNGNGSPLPPGIPAHAQLAPPATQKHILRYVMSAVKNVANGTNKQQTATTMPATDNNNKQQLNTTSNFISKQRPLPILPTQQQQQLKQQQLLGRPSQHQQYAMDQEEDNLYYCGLQARVPAFRRNPTAGQLSSPANINAILTDINGKIVARRGGAFNGYNHQYNNQMYHSSKHHHHHHYQLQQQSNHLSKSNLGGAVLGPKNKLLLDQLKMLSSVQNHPNVLSSSSNLLSNHHNSLFLSADNLNHVHRSNPLLSTTAATAKTAISGASSTKKEKKGVKLFSLSSSSSSNQSTDQLASQDQENSSSKQKASKSTKRTKTTRKS